MIHWHVKAQYCPWKQKFETNKGIAHAHSNIRSRGWSDVTKQALELWSYDSF